jgi:hypothetical protein
MTIDRLFLATVPASIFAAAILYFIFRRRVQHSWRWRMAISTVITIGAAPAVFPDLSGRFAALHFFPMLMFVPNVLSDPTLFSTAGLLAALWLIILPFISTLAFVLFLWFVFIRLKSRYEKPTA